ncbi:MAG: hypothetical protein R3236_10015, partial [Phycisphaeraceae bacterium]|nr:hypothetical protein [Phycisphaeraceae bacterium]
MSDVSVEKAVRIVEKQLGKTVTVDWAPYRKLVQRRRISLDLNNAPASLVLEQIASQTVPDLHWSLAQTEQGLWLGPSAKAPTIAKIYDLSAFESLLTAKWNPAVVMELIKHHHRVVPRMPDPKVVYLGKGRYEIRQRPEAHASLARLLNDFWKLKGSERLCHPRRNHYVDVKTEKTIQTKLNRPVVLLETKLDRALNQLADRLDLNLLVEWESLELAGIPNDQQVSTFHPDAQTTGKILLEQILTQAGGDRVVL